MKKLIVFDLDGTLAPSKSAIDEEMGNLLRDLLAVVKVAVISGGAMPQFEKQVLAHLPTDSRLANLSLLPTCGTRFLSYKSGWTPVYSEDLSQEERAKIIDALNQAVKDSNFKKEQTWGDVIEDRGTQITFSGLGQQAPLEAKDKWDPDFAKRKKMESILEPLLPEFSVKIGGSTSIDITKHGIDKAYGIRKLRDILQIQIDEMIFAGDAIFPGGNDNPAKEAGVDSIKVSGPDETKRVIEAIIACLKPSAV